MLHKLYKFSKTNFAGFFFLDSRLKVSFTKASKSQFKAVILLSYSLQMFRLNFLYLVAGIKNYKLSFVFLKTMSISSLVIKIKKLLIANCYCRNK